MHDIVIRGGSIVDGTGRAGLHRRCRDRRRAHRRGRRQGRAGRREIDAGGLLVTPGWVDVHTHYDGQATWDPLLAPSSWHGVTTVMFGNCGVGFAPVRPEHRGALMELMEGVEEIPGTALAEGLDLGLGELPRLPRRARAPAARDRCRGADGAPSAARLCHGRARDPAARRRRAEDIATMRRLTTRRCSAGAFGFTTSRTDSHKTTRGEHGARRAMPRRRS